MLKDSQVIDILNAEEVLRESDHCVAQLRYALKSPILNWVMEDHLSQEGKPFEVKPYSTLALRLIDLGQKRIEFLEQKVLKGEDPTGALEEDLMLLVDALEQLENPLGF